MSDQSTQSSKSFVFKILDITAMVIAGISLLLAIITLVCAIWEYFKGELIDPDSFLSWMRFFGSFFYSFIFNTTVFVVATVVERVLLSKRTE